MKSKLSPTHAVEAIQAVAGARLQASGDRPDRMAGQTLFPEAIARSQDPHDGLMASGHGDLRDAIQDIQEAVGVTPCEKMISPPSTIVGPRPAKARYPSTSILRLKPVVMCLSIVPRGSDEMEYQSAHLRLRFHITEARPDSAAGLDGWRCALVYRQRRLVGPIMTGWVFRN